MQGNKKIELTCCVSLDYDMGFVPHFLNHYTKLVDSFSFILHSSSEFDIDPIFKNHKTEKWVGRFNAIDKIDLLNKLSEESTHDYILTADIDEFQLWDVPMEGIVWGKLRDRESKGGSLPKLTNENIFKEFPLVTDRTKWGLQLHKPCLFPAGMKMSTPHNLLDMEIEINPSIVIEHFRWANGRLKI